MNYWMMKCEPSAYSIDDLQKAGATQWEGVRNYQARNLMRDEFQVGDLAFFYHSNVDLAGVVGLMRVTRVNVPDATSWDIESKYYDPKSTPETPRWWMVALEFVEKFPEILSIGEMRAYPELDGLEILRIGSRLSVSRVSAAHGAFISSWFALR